MRERFPPFLSAALESGSGFPVPDRASWRSTMRCRSPRARYDGRGGHSVLHLQRVRRHRLVQLHVQQPRELRGARHLHSHTMLRPLPCTLVYP